MDTTVRCEAGRKPWPVEDITGTPGKTGRMLMMYKYCASINNNNCKKQQRYFNPPGFQNNH